MYNLNVTILKSFNILLDKFKKELTIKEIEANIIYFFLINNELKNKKNILNMENNINKALLESLKEILGNNFSLFDMAILFEYIINEDTKSKNGIVFTPKYISDFIFNNVIKEEKIDNNTKILDPACGTSIFLLSALEILHKKLNKSKKEIIEENLYGIDILEENISRSKIILTLACLDELSDKDILKFNLKQENSLLVPWNKTFNIDNFDFIIGNPPYVNPHDLDLKTTKILKENFITTKKGTINIFYAFIEKSMDFIKENGKVSFIVPNNFLTINAAKELRVFLQKNHYIEYILDFTENMIFRPKRTYNTIIVLTKKEKQILKYSLMPLSENIEKDLKNIEVLKMDYIHLDEQKWNLLSKDVLENIYKIEQSGIQIDKMIKTGIATLKDKEYMVDGYDKKLNLYFKKVDEEIIYLEKELIKPIFKISDIKQNGNIDDYKKYIIFPYEKDSFGKNSIINEDKFKKEYPKTYNYLFSIKNILDTRDKGKPNSVSWYAYGRSQGINNIGKKIIYPTFSNNPKFMLIENEEVLFCNGYAIFDNLNINLNILIKILNSSIMKYYVDNTSYPIEGGYMCYQKKYIKRFSIPYLTENEQNFLLLEKDNKAIDNFLMKKYNINV